MNLMTLSIEGSRARLLALVAIVACLLGVHCNAADAKIYLEMKGVPGDVTDRGYENQIAVVSYSVTLAPVGGGSITLLKHVDSSSSILDLFSAAGEAIKRAILRVVASTDGKSDSKLTIDMRDVFISGFQVSGNTTGGIQLETMSLSFTKVDISYSDKGGK